MIITIVLSVLVAFLVPSPALMEESASLITGYGACLGVAVLLACLMMRAGSRQKGAGLPALCIVLGLTGARLFYCLVRIQYYVNEVGIQHIFFLREGGFVLYGAMAGVLLAGYMEARRSGRSVEAVWDDMAVPGMACIAIARFAEGLAGEGLGDWIEDEAFWHLPFGAANLYGEYQWALFLLEGLGALLILLWIRRIRTGEGNRICTAILLYACSQIFYESLRMDSVLKIGFVRVSQVLSAVAILLVTLKRKFSVTHVLVLAACVAGIVGLEFALDKTPVNNVVIYVIMIVLCKVLYFNGEDFPKITKGAKSG